MMECISNISAIFTCCLFVIYLVGRIYTIKKELCFGTERFNLVPSDNSIEHNYDFDFDGKATIEVYSNMAYKSVTVKQVKDYDVKKMEILSYGKSLTINHIPAYTPIYMIIDLPETIPTYVVEFIREDGIKGRYEIYSSGRTGEILPDKYVLTHTFSSYCYYFCR